MRRDNLGVVCAQERGIRSGTVPAPLTVGFGAACALAQREMAADHAHVSALARPPVRRHHIAPVGALVPRVRLEAPGVWLIRVWQGLVKQDRACMRGGCC